MEYEPGAPLAGATAPQPSQRSLRWSRVRELGEAIADGGEPARIVEQARWLVDVLQGLGGMGPWPGLNAANPDGGAQPDKQVALIYSLVLLALVQKTGSTADRPGEPRYRDMRDRWLEATADDLEEIRARLAEVWGSRLGEVVLGDLAAIGHDPVTVLEPVTALHDARITRGSTDRYLVTGDRPPIPPPPGKELEVAHSFAWTQAYVTGAGWFDWLTQLPLEVRLELHDGTRLLGVHAAPGTDDGAGVNPVQSDREVRALLSGCGAELVFTGHTHWALDRTVDGVRAINLGRVSNPWGVGSPRQPRPARRRLERVRGASPPRGLRPPGSHRQHCGLPSPGVGVLGAVVPRRADRSASAELTARSRPRPAPRAASGGTRRRPARGAASPSARTGSRPARAALPPEPATAPRPGGKPWVTGAGSRQHHAVGRKERPGSDPSCGACQS